MKIVSWNVNGIRSAHRKGFLNFLEKEKADIYCFQEIKAQEGDLPQELHNLKNYCPVFNFAERKGYSGVAIYAKEKPISVTKESLGLERFNREGRILEAEYLDFLLINIYIPHGGRQKENLSYKLAVYKKLIKRLGQEKGKNVILVGDFNIAHTEKDLARPGQNKNNIMFTPEERKQINKLQKFGFTDSFRSFNNKNGNYTWWPYAFNARERNLGWRLDYAFVSQSLLSRLKNAFIYSYIPNSDHCPIGLELS